MYLNIKKCKNFIWVVHYGWSINWKAILTFSSHFSSIPDIFLEDHLTWECPGGFLRFSFRCDFALLLWVFSLRKVCVVYRKECKNIAGLACHYCICTIKCTLGLRLSCCDTVVFFWRYYYNQELNNSCYFIVTT